MSKRVGIQVRRRAEPQPAAPAASQEDPDAAHTLNLKQKYDAMGVAIRAGLLTATPEIEEQTRSELGLPPISEAVRKAWEATGGIRQPITLKTNESAAVETELDVDDKAAENVMIEIRAVLEFRPPHRMPRLEWGCWWDKTLDRWHADGLDPRLRNVRWYAPGMPVIPAEGEIGDVLGLDPFRILWPRPISDAAPPPAPDGAYVKDAQEYRRFKKYLFPAEVVAPEYLRELAALKKQGRMALWMWLDGFFWFPRTLLGIEGHLYAFYDQPELLCEMNRDLLEWYRRLLPAMFEIITPDILLLGEDLSYNHGPMLSKEKFDEVCAPFYRELVPLLKHYNIHPLMDSDGDITEVIDWCREIGVEGIAPLERMAGVDLNEIRKNHPDFLLLGGFDKTIMHLGEAAMRREFERILPAVRSGGYIPMPDHQTPPACSLENYKLFRKLFEEYF